MLTPAGEEYFRKKRQAEAERNGEANGQVHEDIPPPESDHHVGEWNGQDPKVVTAVTTSHSGQVRMAYRLADTHRDKLLFVHSMGWHYWTGQRWAYDDTGAAKRAVLAVLKAALAESLGDKDLRRDVQRCESATGISGVLDVAAALTAFAARVDDLDADPFMLNHATGTLDLRTGETRTHDPADRITKVCRGAYHTDASSDAWERFLARVLPDDEVRAFLQRLVGASLLGAVREHVLPILTGTGANGKGTFYSAVLHALGDYAGPAEPELFMHRGNNAPHPTGHMDLLGKRLVVVSESDEGRRIAEATMKRLTGGDRIKARWMKKDFVEFAPSHLPLLVTNHLPKVSGDDPAVWRRIRVIPFDVVIPQAEWDTKLGERLQLEADGILWWAVAGWNDYTTRGSLAEPDAVRVATDDYHKASDAVRRFIDEECVTTSPALKATTGQLHEEFEKWRVRDGAEPMSQKAFGQALDGHGYPVKPSNGKRWRPGIAVKVQVDDEQ